MPSVAGREMTMDVPYYSCEDCGAVFAKTELYPDVEDDVITCPECGGLDIQLVEEPAA
jgi:DNA-directed RNA polymerase subunit RPC12/RpoP